MKLAIIGTGKIVHEALYAMKGLAGIELTALYAREHSREKGEALAKEYGIAEVYVDYEQLLEKADVDTVYIGLVNSAHYTYGKKALLAGKHVIMEKPFCSTVKEAEELLEIAKEKHCYLLEAITVLYGEAFEKMKEVLPKLGKLKFLNSNYSQYSSRYDKYLAGEVEPSFDLEYSGGALYDINLYNCYYAVALLGEGKACQYFPNKGYNGVDTSGTLMIQYDTMQGILTGAKDSDSPCFTMIQGEKGWLRLNGKPNLPDSLDWCILTEGDGSLKKDASGAVVRDMKQHHLDFSPVRHRMTGEFEAFQRIIDEREEEKANLCMRNTLCVMRTLEEARKSAGIVFGVDRAEE